MTKKQTVITIKGKRLEPLANSASGPHLPEPESEQRWRAHMKAYADEEDRARAANGGETPVYATGRFGHPSLQLPTREADAAPDPQHSPELVEDEPQYSTIELLADVYGLDEHGNPKLPEQITPEQAKTRARRYQGVDDAA